VLLLIACASDLTNDYLTGWLAIAGILVAVSALSQVIFAVVAYLESAALRNQIESLRVKAVEAHENSLEQLQTLKRAFYDAAKASIAGLMESLSYGAQGQSFRIAMNNLKLAQMNVDLAHGTYLSLWSAMQNAFKLDKRCFLELESDIVQRSQALCKAERDRILKEFKGLKVQALDSLTKATMPHNWKLRGKQNVVP